MQEKQQSIGTTTWIGVRQAGRAQNMFMSQSQRLSKGVHHFRQIFDRERVVTHHPLLVSGN